jgi:hypothetical protein
MLGRRRRRLSALADQGAGAAWNSSAAQSFRRGQGATADSASGVPDFAQLPGIKLESGPSSARAVTSAAGFLYLRIRLRHRLGFGVGFWLAPRRSLATVVLWHGPGWPLRMPRGPEARRTNAAPPPRRLRPPAPGRQAVSSPCVLLHRNDMLLELADKIQELGLPVFCFSHGCLNCPTLIQLTPANWSRLRPFLRSPPRGSRRLLGMRPTAPGSSQH